MGREVTLDGFKLYILGRNVNFDVKHSLAVTPVSELYVPYNLNVCNNLRYLDTQSQDLIRAVNGDNTSFEDKLLTVVVYRLFSDKSRISKYLLPGGLVDYKAIRGIRSGLNKSTSLKQNYQTILSTKTTEGYTGDLFMAILDKLMSNLSKAKLEGLMYTEVRRLISDMFDSNIVSVELARELALDLSYINELNISQDLDIKGHSLKPHSYKVLRLNNFGGDFHRFVNYMMDWYNSQEVSCNHLRPITPEDIRHMCYGYDTFLRIKGRPITKGSRRKHDVEDLVVPETIVRYYEETNHF